MNRRSIAALIAVNVVLLIAVLVVTTAPQPAQGQIGLTGAEYIMVSGPVTGRNQQDAVYLIELRTARMVGFFFNGSDRSLQMIDAVDMTPDFRAAAR